MHIHILNWSTYATNKYAVYPVPYDVNTWVKG